jgi:hypothetical protein
VDAGVVEGLRGGGQREAVRAIEEAEPLPVRDGGTRLEALHLGGDADAKAAGVEEANRGDTAPTGVTRPTPVTATRRPSMVTEPLEG